MPPNDPARPVARALPGDRDVDDRGHELVAVGAAVVTLGFHVVAHVRATRTITAGLAGRETGADAVTYTVGVDPHDPELDDAVATARDLARLEARLALETVTHPAGARP